MATAIGFALTLAAQCLAGRLPARWDGNWPSLVVRTQAQFSDRFFPFDAIWYWRIATEGYQWDPAQATTMQDVAFFPLWPVILRTVSAVAGSDAATRLLAVLLAAGFAVASVCAFQRLAARLLPGRDALVATWLFALYPAAGFLLLSYPTGLLNLLTILALLALLDGRLWVAAAWSGLATAAGPLGLGTGLTVCCCALARFLDETGRVAGWPRRVALLAELGATGLLAVSGLLAFVAWQSVWLGDPFAFIHAQIAWEPSTPWQTRLPEALAQLLILPDFIEAIRALKHMAHPVSLVCLQLAVERCLNSLAEGIALIGLLAASRIAPAPVVLQGIFTLLIYIWFHGAIRPGNATMRLCYCAIGIFPGVAWLLRGRPRLAVCAICLSGALLAGGALLVADGYHMN